MSISTLTTQITGAGGLSITASNQGGAAALGPQQSGTVGLINIQTDTAAPQAPQAYQSELDCTYPSAVVVAEIVCANTAGNYDFVVPYKCKIAEALYNVGADAPSNNGDTFKFSVVTLAAASTDITTALTVNGAGAYGVVRVAVINSANNSILAGETLRCTVAKVGNVGGTARVFLIPVA